MAGIPEREALARKRQGAAFARHLGVRANSERGRALKFGTARSYGWRPNREARSGSIRAADDRLKARRTY